MVQIEKISNKKLKRITTKKTRNNKWSIINDDMVDFFLLSNNPIVQKFKNVDVIFQPIESNSNTTLIEQNIGEDEEYNINDKH